MTKEELEKEYYASRPTDPYSEDDNSNSWSNIAHYAEENLDKAFTIIAELEKENAEMKETIETLNHLNKEQSEAILDLRVQVKELESSSKHWNEIYFGGK